jgi:inhibitor of KinA
MSVGLFPQAQFRIAGDRGLLVEYGNVIDPVVNNKVRSMAALLEIEPIQGVMEIAPTYHSLLIIYDPVRTTPVEIQTSLAAMEDNLSQITIPPPDTVEIPVCYGGEYGPDIDFVAQNHQLPIEEVIELHSRQKYLIYTLGFSPGFPFLGGLPEKIHTPRLESPRVLVPAGSVGVANNQTGIYPVASPGGWRLIGRTPLRLFLPEKSNPLLYKAGDYLKFKPISAQKYVELDQRGGE